MSKGNLADETFKQGQFFLTVLTTPWILNNFVFLNHFTKTYYILIRRETSTYVT